MDKRRTLLVPIFAVAEQWLYHRLLFRKTWNGPPGDMLGDLNDLMSQDIDSNKNIPIGDNLFGLTVLSEFYC